jgi:hypothetical protein
LTSVASATIDVAAPGGAAGAGRPMPPAGWPLTTILLTGVGSGITVDLPSITKVVGATVTALQFFVAAGRAGAAVTAACADPVAAVATAQANTDRRTCLFNSALPVLFFKSS